jgi:hypothetical protein
MKAITICQPYASLIALPDEDDRAKRVENRGWPSSFVGTLAIHAGKSRDYLGGDNYGLKTDDMPFGAIVAVCEMVGCCKAHPLSNPETGRHLGGMPEPWALRKWPWLAGHQHVEGPYCFVLTYVRRFKEPIPAKGKQGFWDLALPENWESLLGP